MGNAIEILSKKLMTLCSFPVVPFVVASDAVPTTYQGNKISPFPICHTIASSKGFHE